jgi:hypothetical protein
MYIFYILIFFVILYVYFSNKKVANKKKKEEALKRKEALKYLNYSESDLYKIDRIKLKEICFEVAESRNDSLEFLNRSTIETVNNNYNVTNDARNSLSFISRDSYKPFRDYESTIKKLDLELKAESIDHLTYNENINKAKNKLLKDAWNISNIEYEIASKLHELNLISEKELKVVEEREDAETLLEEKIEQEKNIKKKKFYVDYILNK